MALLTLAPVALIVEFALSFGAAFVVMSGIGASCLRAWAVLCHRPSDRVDWWTTFGFLLGGVCMLLFVFMEWLWAGE